MIPHGWHTKSPTESATVSMCVHNSLTDSDASESGQQELCQHLFCYLLLYKESLLANV